MDGSWTQAAARLQTITGVGLLTVSWLLVTTVNFSLCPTPEAATSYAGLAPHPKQSGTSVRGRSSLGHDGNTRLRRALYLATLSAAQHNSVIHAFYTRLRETGKPAKLARCAAARKLLHIAWAVVTKGQDFDPNYAINTNKDWVDGLSWLLVCQNATWAGAAALHLAGCAAERRGRVLCHHFPLGEAIRQVQT